MRMKFFDIETFPNWWCVVVGDEEFKYASSAYKFLFTKGEEDAIKSKMRVYTSDNGPADIEALLSDLSTGCVSGYNIKRFDLIILKCIFLRFTTRQIYIATQLLIGKTSVPEIQASASEVLRISAYVKGWQAKWDKAEAYQDLMDDSTNGLKDKESSFGMDIRESEVPFGKIDLTPEDKESLIQYCKHDVYALHVQYVCLSKPYIDTKLSLGKTYKVPEKTCYQSTNAVLSGIVLGAERVSGTTIKDPTIVIYQKPINDYIHKWVPAEALNHLLTSQKAKQMNMFGNKVFMADGGIHSVFNMPKVGRNTANMYVEADDVYGLYNIDLSGCHPSVMLFCGAMPRGITKPERFRDSVFKRRELKIKPKSEWTKEEGEFVAAGKLIHNTTYGAAGNQYLPLYDDYMRSKVCRVSQLIIIAVAMAVYTQIPGIKIIQTNTDGILLYTERKNKAKLESIIAEFEQLSNFVFELEEDSKIWQLNVNNYIALDVKGKPKLKGKSFGTSIWSPGYNKVKPLGNHIIAKCQYEFYVNGKNPVRMLLEHDHINDFVLTCTKGATYSNMVQKNVDGDLTLGKVTRVLATSDKTLGEVRKQKMNGTKLAEDLCANCPPNALIMNDALSNYTIEGPITNRQVVHISGISVPMDMGYYAKQLDKALDIPWYKLKGGSLTYTTEFNL